MTVSNFVIVAEGDVVGALREHLRADATMMVFDASEAARFVSRLPPNAPRVLAIDRSFADTPTALSFLEEFRGRHPQADIRMLAGDSTGAPQLLKTPITPPADGALHSASYPLIRPTRRTHRHALAADVAAIVNGTNVRVIDLSAMGAQIVSPEIVRPAQRAVLTLSLPSKTVRVEASVAWCALEMDQPTRKLAFRAGLAFRTAVPEIETEMVPWLTSR
jgi:hypothetical protein